MNDALLVALVRSDFVAAVLLTVLLPLALLVWARGTGDRSLERRLIAYWRTASLLMAAVYLLIAAHPLAFAAGVLARAAIPVALVLPWVWPGVDEPPPARSALGQSFTAWRAATVLYCAAGVVGTLPLLGCTFAWQLGPGCLAWTEPAREFGALVHPWLGAGTARWIGLAGGAAWLGGIGVFVVRSLLRRPATR